MREGVWTAPSLCACWLSRVSGTGSPPYAFRRVRRCSQWRGCNNLEDYIYEAATEFTDEDSVKRCEIRGGGCAATPVPLVSRPSIATPASPVSLVARRFGGLDFVFFFGSVRVLPWYVHSHQVRWARVECV
jgi:hypothetical protein